MAIEDKWSNMIKYMLDFHLVGYRMKMITPYTNSLMRLMGG